MIVFQSNDMNTRELNIQKQKPVINDVLTNNRVNLVLIIHIELCVIVSLNEKKLSILILKHLMRASATNF